MVTFRIDPGTGKLIIVATVEDLLIMSRVIEQMDKGSEGMASTFLVRLRVGPRLVDAKGVSRLYRASVKPGQLLVLVFSALAVITVVVFISAPVRSFLSLLVLGLRTAIGL